MTARTVLIGETWQTAETEESLPVVDPSDGNQFAELSRGGTTEVDRAVRSARQALNSAWGRLNAADRGRLLAKLSQAIWENAEDLARLESRDTGKPLSQGKADATAAARYFEFYAGAADKMHGSTIPYQNGYTVFTLREPHGVTGHIIPWNYPLQVLGRSLAAALTMGNAAVLKPAEDACLSCLKIAQLALDVGFPPGAINIVTGTGEEAGAALAAHPGIDHLSFTGSPETGTAVAQAAANHHCSVTLELGGKSPQIVFADADLDAALPYLVRAAVQNSGQTCSAGSRLLVEKTAKDRVVERVATAFAGLKVGPWDADPDLGPLINATQQARVRRYLDQAMSDGFVRIAEGSLLPNTPKSGFFELPVLLSGGSADHPLAQEEVFGPVLSVHLFDSEAEAIALANGTPFGLVAGVWTNDGRRQLRLARGLKCGQVFINNYGAGGGVELPFGGVRRSGYGREKGFEALYAFSTLKTVALYHQ